MEGNCPAGAVVASVRIPGAVFGAGQSVTVRAVLHNVGMVPCAYSGLFAPPQEIGPCGVISMEIENAKGVNVWPGNQAFFSCPALGPESLPPGASVVDVP